MYKYLSLLYFWVEESIILSYVFEQNPITWTNPIFQVADGEWVHSLTCAWYTEQASSTRAINRMPRKLSRDLCGDGIRFSGAITRLTRLTYLQVYLSKETHQN